MKQIPCGYDTRSYRLYYLCESIHLPTSEQSSRVIVISLTGRGKDEVSWYHLSLRAFTKPLFVVGYYAVTRDDNPDHNI